MYNRLDTFTNLLLIKKFSELAYVYEENAQGLAKAENKTETKTVPENCLASFSEILVPGSYPREPDSVRTERQGTYMYNRHPGTS